MRAVPSWHPRDRMGYGDAIQGEEIRALPEGGASSTWGRRELTLRHGELRFLIVDDTGAGISARLEPYLRSGNWLRFSDTSPPHMRYNVEIWRPSWGVRGTGYRVSRNDELQFLGGSPDRLAQWLRADIDETIARRGGASLVLQAAVLVWRERAILIPSWGRSGTSTLAAELVLQGATQYSDGPALFDDEARVRPHEGALSPPHLPVALVVSTTYRPDAAWLPQRLRGARAVLPIIDSALAEGNEPQRVLRLCARLAGTVLTLQGPRPDASIAAPRILADLDAWLDDRPQTSVPATQLSRGLARVRLALVRARTGRARRPAERPRVV